MPRGLLDPRHGEALDLAGAPVQRRLLIASTPRTGSTLLARMLWATGRAAAPKEYLNPTALRDWAWRRAGPVERRLLELIPRDGVAVWAAARVRSAGFRRDHLRQVLAHRTDAKGLFALKLHAHHARSWWADHPFADGVVVRLVREDVVGQAISWARARATNRWAAHQPDRPFRDRPDASAVDRRLEAIEADTRWWDDTLAGHIVLRLSCEALVADPEGTVRQVLRALDDPLWDEVIVPPPPTRKQADGRAAVWRDVWRASRGEGTDLHRRL